MKKEVKGQLKSIKKQKGDTDKIGNSPQLQLWLGGISRHRHKLSWTALVTADWQYLAPGETHSSHMKEEIHCLLPSILRRGDLFETELL
jgi:hypothetical protein